MAAWDDMTDEQLMDLAKRTMVAASAQIPGSVEWAMTWAGYDAVMNQLKIRIARHLNKQLGLPDIDL
jgi:hypothetical protein